MSTEFSLSLQRAIGPELTSEIGSLGGSYGLEGARVYFAFRGRRIWVPIQYGLLYLTNVARDFASALHAFSRDDGAGKELDRFWGVDHRVAFRRFQEIWGGAEGEPSTLQARASAAKGWIAYCDEGFEIYPDASSYALARVEPPEEKNLFGVYLEVPVLGTDFKEMFKWVAAGYDLRDKEVQALRDIIRQQNDILERL